MLNELLFGINKMADQNSTAWSNAADKLSKVKSEMQTELADLLGAANTLSSDKGTSLLNGQKFSFDPPDKEPVYDPEKDSFSATIFKAKFGDEPARFQISVRLSGAQTTTHWTGCADQEGSWPLSSHDRKEIYGQFSSWLTRMKLRYPAKPTSKPREFSNSPPSPPTKPGRNDGWMR